ncbi:MAG: hypothetical protein ABFD24_06015 [Anaerolineaceae bacterium]
MRVTLHGRERAWFWLILGFPVWTFIVISIPHKMNWLVFGPIVLVGAFLLYKFIATLAGK